MLSQGCAPTTQLEQTVRQYLANLLNVCLSVNTPQGNVGGVFLDFQVDLTGFEDEAAALGLTGSCVTVGEVLAAAEDVVAGCDQTGAQNISPILSAMAQDANNTIIIPQSC